MKDKAKRRTAAVCVLTVALVAPAMLGATDPAEPTVDINSCPKPNKETLEYEFGWNDIAAAHAKVEIKEDEYDKKPVLKLTAEAHTIGTVRRLWKMDDRMEAIVHKETLSPIRVELHRREGDDEYRTNTYFSWEDRTANMIDVKGTRVKKKSFSYGNAYDPLTLVLLVRCLDFKVGQAVTFDVIESDDVYRVQLDVLGRENIAVKAGEFDAFKVVPTFYKVKKNGKIKKENVEAEDVVIWVSDTPEKYMLKIVSKVFVGNVYGELMKASK